MTEPTPNKPRKKARQARSQATVDAIVQATAHILREKGAHKLSTNAVAKRAGVSIGSLYQYFPNKESLILELGRQRAERMLTTLSGLAAGSLEDIVRGYVAANIAEQRKDPALQAALTTASLTHGIGRLRTDLARGRQVVAAFLSLHLDDLRIADPEMAAFICVGSVSSLLHGATLEDPALLNNPAFGEEVVQLVLRYLRG